MNRAPRILEAQSQFVGSYDPDADARLARPRQSAKSWPPAQSADAIEAACFAGFVHFIRERDPDRAKARWDKLPDRARQIRRAETAAVIAAYKAAGGR
ncbi:hypothetical protein ACLNGM_14895 [Aureimonas phyllosphaerae]|uniref:hypothetical protein n=1 Tax=Aureimonas phyllosphaerae TaxID=1166078 RepID=UPI003A5C6D94